MNPDVDESVVKDILNNNVGNDPILKYFTWEHLRDEALRTTSMKFAVMAAFVLENIPRSAERTAGLRKLLEAKDCIVRAKLP